MKLTKSYTKTYDIEFYPNADFLETWGEFKAIREKHNQKTSQFSKCFICSHPFAEDEKIIIAAVKAKGNRFVCEKCLGEHGNK